MSKQGHGHEEKLRQVLHRYADPIEPGDESWERVVAKAGESARASDQPLGDAATARAGSPHRLGRTAGGSSSAAMRLFPGLVAGVVAAAVILSSAIVFTGRVPEATFADAGVVSNHYAPVPGPADVPDSSAVGRLQTRGYIRIGIKYDQPGFGFRKNPKADPKGFDVDIARLVALAIYGGNFEQMDDRIRWVEVKSKDRELYLQSGKVDMVVATYTMTDQRREQIDFAGPYFRSQQDIMIRKDDGSIDDVEDLSGRRVCTVKGSTSYNNLIERVPDVVAVLEDRYSECAEALADKDVDAVTTDAQILAGYVLQSRYQFELLRAPFSDEPYGIGVRKGEEQLRSFINFRLKEISANGDSLRAARASLIGIDTELFRPPEILP